MNCIILWMKFHLKKNSKEIQKKFSQQQFSIAKLDHIKLK